MHCLITVDSPEGPVIGGCDDTGRARAGVGGDSIVARLTAATTCSWTIARTSCRPTGVGGIVVVDDELGGLVVSLELLLPVGPDTEMGVVLEIGGETGTSWSDISVSLTVQ